jgi:hypothetical protein
VLAFRVDDVKHHLKEHEVVVLSSKGGLAESFSIPWGAALGEFPQVTDLRVGPDGDLYLMQTDPRRGLTILRYGLVATPAPTTKPTATPIATPTGAPSGTLPGSPSQPTSPAGSSTPRAGWIVASLGGLALAGGVALAWWLRRRRPGGATG